jgi:hypothetical protein
LEGREGGRGSLREESAFQKYNPMKKAKKKAMLIESSRRCERTIPLK